MSSQMPAAEAETENPYAAPTAHVSDVAQDAQLELASRATRLGAFLLDNALMLGPMFIVLFYIGFTTASQRADQTKVAAGMSGMFAVVGLIFLVLVIVNLIFLYNSGQTIGKRWLGIKIVRLDGSRCGLARILFLRSLPLGFLGGILNRIVPPLGYIVTLADGLSIFRNDRRCLHDLIADTKVVKV